MPAPEAILLRYSGEISTKARPTRRQFVSRLLRNLQAALAQQGIEAHIECAHERVRVASGSARAADALANVFGVQSLSRVVRTPAAELAPLVARAAEVFAPQVAGKRFAARVRLVGNQQLSYGARDVERALGSALLPHAAGVDLDAPEAVARVEVWRGEGYLCVDSRDGPGGLPIGCEGHAVALVSGGFDSAVAAWLLMKRGVSLDFVFCNLGGRSHELGALRVVQRLIERWGHGAPARLHALDFAPVSQEIQAHARRRYWQVLLKRFMLRAAEALAHELHAEAIVTGEALGQVSSQTLTNLAAIEEVVSLPVLRPLLGFNKDEIIARARRIGTEELSAVVDEYCAMVPRNPATAARVQVLREEELGLDLGVLTKQLGERELIDLRSVDLDARALPELAVETIPQGAVVVDLRTRAQFAGWHWPGSVRLDVAEALRTAPALPRDKTYVFSCDFGLKSAHVVEVLRDSGLRVHHLRGGTQRLRQLASEGEAD